MPAVRSIDETGKKYGDLTVERRLPAKHGKAQWHCYCDACGGSRKVSGADLRNGTATHCGCKTEREYPTLAGIAKQLAELSARVAVLETAPATTPSRAALDLKVTPDPEPAPTPAPQKPAPQAQPDLDKAIARIQELAAIPFHERGERLAELREEMRLNIEIVVNDLRKVSDYNPRFKGDPVGEARNDQLVGFMLAHKKYHLNPDA